LGVLVGIDIGGTFTDLVALDTGSGKLTVTKVPSTPEDFSQGFLNGLRKIQELCGASPSTVRRLVHGTTVATNAILEQKGAGIGILLTKGFRDTLIMGRGIRRELYNVFIDPETPVVLCPRERMLEIGERLDSQGHALKALDEDDVIKAIEFLVGGAHYRGFRDYIKQGGLEGILKNHKLAPEKRDLLKNGIAAIIKVRNT